MLHDFLPVVYMYDLYKPAWDEGGGGGAWDWLPDPGGIPGGPGRGGRWYGIWPVKVTVLTGINLINSSSINVHRKFPKYKFFLNLWFVFSDQTANQNNIN